MAKWKRLWQNGPHSRRCPFKLHRPQGAATQCALFRIFLIDSSKRLFKETPCVNGLAAAIRHGGSVSKVLSYGKAETVMEQNQEGQRHQSGEVWQWNQTSFTLKLFLRPWGTWNNANKITGHLVECEKKKRKKIIQHEQCSSICEKVGLLMKWSKTLTRFELISHWFE